MLNTFTVASFAPHLGETFRVRLPDASAIEVTLTEASVLTSDDDSRRQRAPFRLTFRDPSRRIAQQAIYALEHDGFEPMSLFLVPIRVDASGLYVEAIFT
jgi:hypothetical protein